MSKLTKKHNKSEPQLSASVEAHKSQLSASDCCEQGQILLDKGKPLQALEYYQAAIDLDQDNVAALYGLLTVYNMTGKIDKADDILHRLEKLSLKNPSANVVIPSSQEQLENEKRRYMNLLYTLLIIETDEFGLKHGRYSSEDNAVLLACEDSIHRLEDRLSKNRTDFDKIRNGVFEQYASKPAQIQAVIDKLLRKYGKICEDNVIEENGIYTFSYDTTKELTQIEESIKFLDSYLNRQTDMQLFQAKRSQAIRNYINGVIEDLLNEYSSICNGCVTEINGAYGYSDDTILQLKEIEREILSLDPQMSKQTTDRFVSIREKAVLDQLKIRYQEFIKLNLVKNKNDKKKPYMVSDKVTVQERSLRSQIVATMGERGNEWCNNEIKAAVKQKNEEAKETKKFIWILIAVAITVTLFVVFTEVMLYILLGIVGLIAFIAFGSTSKR